MSRRRKDAAEKLMDLLAGDQERKVLVREARRAVKIEEEKKAAKRQKILAEACLAYFSDPAAVKNARVIESLLMSKMKPSARKWYNENPHQLIAVEAPPEAATPAQEAPKPSGHEETGSGNTAPVQANPNDA